MVANRTKGQNRVIVGFLSKKVDSPKKDGGADEIVRNLFIRPMSHVAEHFKMKEADNAQEIVKKNGEKGQRYLFGSQGSKTIKVVEKKGDKRTHWSIPVPSVATIYDIYTFLADATNWKEQGDVIGFISPGGRFYPKSKNLDSVAEIKAVVQSATKKGSKNKKIAQSPHD